MNLYGFASGNPVNFSDPFGLRPCPPDNDCSPTASEMMAAARGTGRLLRPAQLPLEVAGFALINAPFAGEEGAVALVEAGSEIANAGGAIRSFVLDAASTYYRVFTETRVGRFLTRVPPRSASYAREALALPPQNTAEFVQEVVVPAGTRLQRSRTLPAFGRRGGAEQFELLERIPNESFGTGRRLPP